MNTQINSSIQNNTTNNTALAGQASIPVPVIDTQTDMFTTKGYDMNRLSDKDLLGKLIGVREAEYLYSTGGSLHQAFSNKDNAPEMCLVARELLTRWMGEEMRQGDSLNSPNSVRDYLMLHFAGQEYESFVAIFLDSQHKVISSEVLFRGTLQQTSVYPREVVKAALKLNAGTVIFAHNHPSGVNTPSQSDRMLTDALKQALALVDVRVLDHFIIAGNTSYSFADKGIL
jgi:DNA repair protein RadC